MAPQQPPDSAASAALPQQGLAAMAVAVEVVVVPAWALPQQPPADGGVNAWAGSPVNPPEADVVVMMEPPELSELADTMYSTDDRQPVGRLVTVALQRRFGTAPAAGT